MDTQDNVKLTLHQKQTSWHKGVLCLMALVVWLLAALCFSASGAFSNPLIHNSTTTGSTKWPLGWGIAGGEYGEFDCSTCHDRKTGNIKRIKASIDAPEATDTFPAQVDSGTITFNATTGADSFGDDSTSHTMSSKICEVCHSRNKFHNYNSANNIANGGDLTHENQKDCIACHLHSNGFGASCDACHGNPPITADTDGSTTTGMVHDPSPTDATSPASPGAHELHVVTEGMSCTTCHKGNTMPTVSMTIQMGFEASNGNWSQFVGYNSGGNLDAPDDAGGQMSASYEFVSSDGGTTTITKVANNDLNCTVYCHGDWVGSGGSNTTPSWVGGSGEASCGSCHGAAPGNAPTAGSHTTHASSGNLGLACTKCHPTVSVGDSTHINGNVSWELATSDPMFGATAQYDGSASGSTGAVAQGVAYSQCSNVYCHAPGAPTWGGTVNCGDCHKSNKTLPDSHATHYNSATNGDSALSTKVTGDTATYVYQCGSCHHSAPHSDGSKDVLINANWDDNGTPADNWTGGTSTCSGTYCHSDGVGNSDNTPTDPVWASTLMTCGSCHKAQPTTGEHAAHFDNATYDYRCYECHAVTTTNADDASVAINNMDTHVDKTKDVDWGAKNSDATSYVDGETNCATYCHSDGTRSSAPYSGEFPVIWNSAVLQISGCNGCHKASFTGLDTYAHEMHMLNMDQTGRQISCGNCHRATATDTTTIAGGGYAYHVNKEINVKFDNSLNLDGDGPLYNTASTVGAAGATVTPGTAVGSCDNVYCHSVGNLTDTGALAPFDATDGFKAVAWDTTGIDCADCHGDGNTKAYPVYTNGGVAADTANSHVKHVENASVLCSTCHEDTTISNTIDPDLMTLVNVSSHLDRGETVLFNSAIAGASAAYDGSSGGNTKVCSNAYCHSNGAGGAANDNTPQWGESGSCIYCHNGNVTSGSPMATNKHGAHINNAGVIGTNYGCTDCHSDTVSDDTTIGTPANHVNQSKEVSYAGAGSYTSPTCDQAYCHSSGQATTNYRTVADWDSGTTYDCKGCHGADSAFASVAGEPNYTSGTAGSATANSHDAHVAAATDCAKCHFDTTTAAGTAIKSGATIHTDGTRDVVIANDGGGVGDFDSNNNDGTDNYNSGTKACSNITCHGGASPVWGGTVACGDCHGDSSHTNGDDRDGAPPTDMAGLAASYEVGKHDKHINISFSKTGDYCNLCHMGAGSGSANHANGTVNVIFNTAVAGASAAWADTGTNVAPGGTCSNLATGCHGGTQWDPALTLACNSCHGFGGSDPSHVTDSRGISAGQNCEHCHPTGHPVGVTATTYMIPNNSDVGIDYDSGGIHLLKMINSVTRSTEAEICWACHDAQTPTKVSEWGTNTSTNGLIYDYDFGSLVPSNWVGATWTSAVFSYKTSTIQSTHSANTSGATNGVDNVADIRCSYCHDVHDTASTTNPALATYDVDGKPFLRGRWMGSPYLEDGAPQAGATYAQQNLFGLVPRGGTGATETGGYYIDQNTTNDPDTEGWTAFNSAALCELCHGGATAGDGTFSSGEIAALNYYGTDDSAGWVGTVNGHANAVLGGPTNSGSNIFSSYDRMPGESIDLAYTGDGTYNEQPVMAYKNADGSWLSSDGNEGWGLRGYNKNESNVYNLLPRIANGTDGTPYAFEFYSWGARIEIDLSTGGDDFLDQNYHKFSCSKCHNPHASRLPKLMITNCLDTKHNTWDDTSNTGIDGTPATGMPTYNQSKTWSNTSSAQNCHRLKDPNQTNSAGSGWNHVTPWTDAAGDYSTVGDESQDSYNPATSPSTSGM
jgi:predicted CxxxxCH...CXXCH cytochrome family protein